MQVDKSVLCAQAAGMAKTRAVQAANQRWGIDIGFMRARSGKKSAPWRHGCSKEQCEDMRISLKY
jgi:hypothetical protein